MGRGTYEPKLEAYLDTPEKIQQCLHCPRPKCNGCKTGRRGNPVIRIAADGTETVFQSVRNAAISAGLSYSAISRAIRSGGKAAGARWIYQV